jgi:YesN/AraC family two-component response regulator
MLNKILLIEDNDYKREKIRQCIFENFENFTIEEARSFTSGWKKINSGPYDLVCLDMSLPSVDKNKLESGGEFRTFGGKEIAQKCKRRRLDVNYVVLTQYKNFSYNNTNYTFSKLKNEFKEEFPDSCAGFLLFSNNNSQWKKELVEILRAIE